MAPSPQNSSGFSITGLSRHLAMDETPGDSDGSIGLIRGVSTSSDNYPDNHLWLPNIGKIRLPSNFLELLAAVNPFFSVCAISCNETVCSNFV